MLLHKAPRRVLKDELSFIVFIPVVGIDSTQVFIYFRVWEGEALLTHSKLER